MPRDELVASLLRGFAQHRTQSGKPDDHWLPRDIYDPTSWSIDSVWIHIITDGHLGGPTPGGLRQEPTHTCHQDGEARSETVARLAQTLSDEEAAAAAAPSWQEQLTQRLGCDLASAAAELTASGRPAFLARLKAAGVEQLAERQKLANSLAKASREGRL